MQKAVVSVAIVSLALAGCASPKLQTSSVSMLKADRASPQPAIKVDPDLRARFYQAEQLCQARYDSLNQDINRSKNINTTILLAGVGLGFVSAAVAAGHAAAVAKAAWAALATGTTAASGVFEKTSIGSVAAQKKADDFKAAYKLLDDKVATGVDVDTAKKDLNALQHFCETGKPSLDGQPAEDKKPKQ